MTAFGGKSHAVAILSLLAACSGGGSNAAVAVEPTPLTFEIDRGDIIASLEAHPNYAALVAPAQEVVILCLADHADMIDAAVRGFKSLDQNHTFGSTATQREQLLALVVVMDERHFAFSQNQFSPIAPGPQEVWTALGLVHPLPAVMKSAIDPHRGDLENSQFSLALQLGHPAVQELQPAILDSIGFGVSLIVEQLGEYEIRIAGS